MKTKVLIACGMIVISIVALISYFVGNMTANVSNNQNGHLIENESEGDFTTYSGRLAVKEPELKEFLAELNTELFTKKLSDHASDAEFIKWLWEVEQWLWQVLNVSRSAPMTKAELEDIEQFLSKYFSAEVIEYYFGLAYEFEEDNNWYRFTTNIGDFRIILYMEEYELSTVSIDNKKNQVDFQLYGDERRVTTEHQSVIDDSGEKVFFTKFASASKILDIDPDTIRKKLLSLSTEQFSKNIKDFSSDEEIIVWLSGIERWLWHEALMVPGMSSFSKAGRNEIKRFLGKYFAEEVIDYYLNITYEYNDETEKYKIWDGFGITVLPDTWDDVKVTIEDLEQHKSRVIVDTVSHEWGDSIRHTSIIDYSGDELIFKMFITEVGHN